MCNTSETCTLAGAHTCMEEEVSRMPSNKRMIAFEISGRKRVISVYVFFIPVSSASSDKQCGYVVRRIS